MKMRTIALAAMIGCALGAGIASAQREARESNLQQNSATTLQAFVQKWQQRIVNENLSVADPQNWAARSLPKLASFSAERLNLAMGANSIGELEAMLVSAPVPNGTGLGLLMATKPGNISLDALSTHVARGAVTKSDPTGSPAAYADMVFTALNPCRILDSRVSQGGAGPWINGASRIINIGPNVSYAFQGGSATSCGLNTLGGSGAEIGAVMLAVSSFTQTGPGYLTLYSPSIADPSATVVSMFYTAGPVQTAFVVAATDEFPPDFVEGISRSANTEVAIDIVGYFAKPKALALDCVDTAIVTAPINQGPFNGGVFFAFSTPPACAAGYTSVALRCGTNNALASANENSVVCSGAAFGNSTYILSASQRCCRTPGR